MLEPGDIFSLSGTLHKVIRIQKDRIYYRYIFSGNNEAAGALQSMGANSSEKLILITNKTKNNEHQNRSNHFRKS